MVCECGTEGGKKTKTHEMTSSPQVRKQVEFWFDDENISSDDFLRSLIEKDPEGWVDLSVVCGFRKLVSLGATAADVRGALLSQQPPSDVVEVSADGLRLRRRKPLPAAVRRRDCIVVAWPCLPEQGPVPIADAFSAFGKVFSVRFPGNLKKQTKKSETPVAAAAGVDEEMEGIDGDDAEAEGVVSSFGKKTVAFIRFVTPEAAAAAVAHGAAALGFKSLMTLEQWTAKRNEIKQKRAVAAASASATEGKKKQKKSLGSAASGSEMQVDAKKPQRRPFCLLGPVPFSVPVDEIRSAFKPFSEDVVFPSMERLQMSRFVGDVTPGGKPLIDVQVRFSGVEQTKAALRAVASDSVSISGRTVKLMLIEPGHPAFSEFAEQTITDPSPVAAAKAQKELAAKEVAAAGGDAKEEEPKKSKKAKRASRGHGRKQKRRKS